MSRELRKAVAEVDDPHFGLPSSVGFRLPLQAKRIRWRQESLRLNREARVCLFKETPPVSRSGAVEVSIRGQAVIENNVAIVLRVRA